jgi:hypothetical protein
MKYYGIKTPQRYGCKPYIWWIAESSYKSWASFFNNTTRGVDQNPCRAPLEEAVKAYEAIGYECVELDVTIINR